MDGSYLVRLFLLLRSAFWIFKRERLRLSIFLVKEDMASQNSVTDFSFHLTMYDTYMYV